VDNEFHHKDTKLSMIGNIGMRLLFGDINSSVSGPEEPADNDDSLTPEEKNQLRELCVLIVISEFLESNNEIELFTARSQRPQS
jgi:hypothetical protein